MSFKQRYSDELLLEQIQRRMKGELEQQGDSDITPEELILRLLRQIETEAYNYGVLEMRTYLMKGLGYNIP